MANMLTNVYMVQSLITVGCLLTEP